MTIENKKLYHVALKTELSTNHYIGWVIEETEDLFTLVSLRLQKGEEFSNFRAALQYFAKSDVEYRELFGQEEIERLVEKKLEERKPPINLRLYPAMTESDRIAQERALTENLEFPGRSRFISIDRKVAGEQLERFTGTFLVYFFDPVKHKSFLSRRVTGTFYTLRTKKEKGIYLCFEYKGINPEPPLYYTPITSAYLSVFDEQTQRCLYDPYEDDFFMFHKPAHQRILRTLPWNSYEILTSDKLLPFEESMIDLDQLREIDRQEE
jgi:hypothetical protein